MKIEIQELFRDWEEEDLTVTPRHSVSPETIGRRVQAKLHGKPQRRFSPRKGILVLAACLVLAGSALAYTQYRLSQVERVDQKTVETYGLLQGFQSDTLYAVQPEEDSAVTDAPHILGLRPTYLTDEISETESTTLGNQLAYWDAQSGSALCSATTLDEADLGSAYTHICMGPTSREAPTGWWTVNVDIFSGVTELDLPMVIAGENITLEEGTFQGMEATWLTQDWNGKQIYNLVLYAPAYDCVIHVGCSSYEDQMGFAELEEIAAGLELVATGSPADYDAGADWSVLSVARG